MTLRASTRLSTLLDAAGVQPIGQPGADPDIVGATLDSRQVGPGYLFFAIRGFEQDGEAFIPDAIERGATAVVAASERPEWIASDVAWVRVAQPRRAAGPLSRQLFNCPDDALTLVGITGTNGKTTVAHMVEAMAIASGMRAGRIGTIGNAFAGQERPSRHTTPDAPDFYRLLAEMRDEAVELVAMEVSSHALSLSRVAGARFASALFLNLTRDHLDYHETEEAYFEAKAQLFAGLSEEACAVLPHDSEYTQRLRAMTAARVITFGRSPDADVQLLDEHCGLDGSSAILRTPSGKLPIRTFLLGRFNLDNIAAAAACALASGIPAEAIATGILRMKLVPGRTQLIDSGQPFRVVVDYAHTEDALRSVLEGLRELTPGRLSVVFGCGGNRDTGKRGAMGRIAAEFADRVTITSDNPRDEDPAAIADAVYAGAVRERDASERTIELHCELDRRAAIQSALSRAEAGDVVVIAGKGHESIQISAGKRVEFDDRIVATESLAVLGWDGGVDA